MEALEGLGVAATAEKLGKVGGYIRREIHFRGFTFQLLFHCTVVFQQACKSTCSQITDMNQPGEEEGDGVKRGASVEVPTQI